jgi:hypothetical protein
MLNSVDLFTGIGGFTLALEGYCRPLLYCDNKALIISALGSMMSRNMLPKAPVVTDVRDLEAIKAAVRGRAVHVLTAGFPCVGFSKSGTRAGLGNEQSALFHDTVKVMVALKPGMALFENVGEIINANDGKDIKLMLGVLVKQGYVVRWTMCAAADVGAPQTRRRWFCLCVRKGYECPPFKFSSRSPWSRAQPRLIVNSDPSHSKRFSMLGNAIVPFAARVAFVRMLTGFHVIFPKTGTYTHAASIPGRKRAGAPHLRHGQCDHGEVTEFKVPSVVPIALDVLLDKDHYETKIPYKMNAVRKLARSPLVKEPFVMHMWPTPRASLATHAHVLSVRTIHDLPTTAMYAAAINGVKQPKTRDGQGINTRFVEWLMGYPLGHTEFA